MQQVDHYVDSFWQASEKKEILCCDLTLIYVEDEEFSFEETRANQLGYLAENMKPLESQFVTTLKAPKESITKVASPTINTKAAMEDVFQMFSKPLAEEDEDVTISTKVYRPEIPPMKLAVFKDSDSEDEDCDIPIRNVYEDDPGTENRSKFHMV
jgi:hypothetical protein